MFNLGRKKKKEEKGEENKPLSVTNRYKDIIYFTEITENSYKITSIDQKGEIVDYGWRIGLKENSEHIEFIDPPGGPFITYGYKLPNDKEVKLITKSKEGDITLITN